MSVVGSKAERRERVAMSLNDPEPTFELEAPFIVRTFGGPSRTGRSPGKDYVPQDDGMRERDELPRFSHSALAVVRCLSSSDPRPALRALAVHVATGSRSLLRLLRSFCIG